MFSTDWILTFCTKLFCLSELYIAHDWLKETQMKTHKEVQLDPKTLTTAWLLVESKRRSAHLKVTDSNEITWTKSISGHRLRDTDGIAVCWGPCGPHFAFQS
jgi:hypothetical protein